MTEAICPICGKTEDGCGHLVAKFEQDEFGEVSDGAILTSIDDLSSKVSSIFQECIRTQEYLWLGDEFSSILDLVKNFGDDMDADEILDNFSSQIQYAICSLINDDKDVTSDTISSEGQVGHEQTFDYYWANDPVAVVSRVDKEITDTLESLESQDSAEDQDIEDEEED